MTSPKTMAFQNDINGLRGLSVLLVVLYHFHIGLFGGGFIGVDIFFVISGFLMTKIILSALQRGDFHYLDFVLRRAARIFPALFFLIFFLLAVAYFVLPPSDLNSLAKQALQAIFFTSNNYFAGQQGYFNAGADDSWLLHTWSLSVEWQFYMLYPALLWACFRLDKRLTGGGAARYLVPLLLSAFLLSLFYCVFRSSQQAFFSVLTRAWEMMAGGLVYLAVSGKAPARRGGALLSYAGIALILLSSLLVKWFALEALWPSYFALAPVAGACMVLLARCENNLFLNNRFMQTMGKWSYSIYLWHWPLLIALTISGLLHEQPRPYKILGIVLSIGLGYLSYRFVESKNFLGDASKRAALAKISASAAALALAAYSALLTNGYMARVDNLALYQSLERAEVSNTFDPACENPDHHSDRFCRINAGAGGKKILIIGDSHAGHLYPWFLAHSKVDTTFFVKSGCPVIPGFERVGVERACREFSKKAYELARSGNYQSVLISQNWGGFSGRSDAICSFYGGKCVPLNQSPNPALALEQVQESIRQVMAKGVRVVVLDGTPWFNVSVPKNISREMFWFGTVGKDVESRRFLTGDNAEFDQLFRSLKGSTNFEVLSFREQLCQRGDCTLYDTALNLPIYKDQNHFNPAWIVQRGDIFLPLAN